MPRAKLGTNAPTVNGALKELRKIDVSERSRIAANYLIVNGAETPYKRDYRLQSVQVKVTNSFLKGAAEGDFWYEVTARLRRLNRYKAPPRHLRLAWYWACTDKILAELGDGAMVAGEVIHHLNLPFSLQVEGAELLSDPGWFKLFTEMQPNIGSTEALKAIKALI